MKLLRTEDLNKLLTTNPVTSPTYLGTYPACIIPKTRKKRYSWISNTDSHDEKGEHWCYFCVDNDKLMFFDSYGRSADDPTLPTNYTTITEKFRKKYYSQRRIQSWDSVTCGYFCIHFIYIFCLGLDYINFLQDYSFTDFERNDKFVSKFVDSIS